MRQLHRLRLDTNQIDDEGVISLANCPQITNLVQLYLWNKPTTRLGCLAFENSPSLQSMVALQLPRGVGRAKARGAHVERFKERIGRFARF